MLATVVATVVATAVTTLVAIGVAATAAAVAIPAAAGMLPLVGKLLASPSQLSLVSPSSPSSFGP